jgi:hypothetical protein
MSKTATPRIAFHNVDRIELTQQTAFAEADDHSAFVTRTLRIVDVFGDSLSIDIFTNNTILPVIIHQEG